MIPDPLSKTVVIPVQVRAGALEFLYGGDIPRLKDGAISDLGVPSYQAEDKGKLLPLEREIEKEFTSKGAPLFPQVKLDNSLKEDASKMALLHKTLTARPPMHGYFAQIILNEALMSADLPTRGEIEKPSNSRLKCYDQG